MSKSVTTLASALVVAHLGTISVTGAQTAGSAQPHKLSEFLRGKGSVRTVELYHIDHRLVTYRARITLEHLLTMSVRDYARMDARNSDFVQDLYSALQDTHVYPERSCEQSALDVRWAIVLTYTDDQKDAVGVGVGPPCVQLLSREAALPAARQRLFQFIQRAFPFTQADQAVNLQDDR